jgi:toxin ParE1/3/4
LEIWVYVATDNPRAADRLIEAIRSRCSVLARLPRLGRLRPELAPEIRSFPVGRYLILYRESDSGIEVARVRAGEQDLSRLFDQ